MTRPTDKWSAPSSGERYAATRFASRRAAERDPRLVAALLARHGVRGRLLDVPCGTARLHDVLRPHAGALVGADLSEAMLASAARSSPARFVRAEVAHLPFHARSFDVVVCCRFLHHLHDESELAAALAELVRVSDRLVVGSVWDSASWPALRVRLGLKRAEGPRGRRAVERATVERLVARAGARVVEWRYSFRWLSQQAFFVAERC